MTTFKQAARDYFLQWWIDDKPFWEEARSGKITADWVDSLIRYYQVPRTFPGKGPGRLRKMLPHIDKARSIDDPVDRVMWLAEQAGRIYKKGQPRSAASKILWMFDRDHVLIMDSRARKAFDRMRGEGVTALNQDDYLGFCERWNDGYKNCKTDIKKACEDLPQDVQVEWFRRRVFDKWLWSIGG